MTRTTCKEHNNIDEFRGSLQNLDDAGWSRLRKLAQNRCRYKRPGEEDEVLQEAITRVLEERRPWPKGLNIFAFLHGVMKSIVSERMEKDQRAPSAVEVRTLSGPSSLETSAAGEVLQSEVETHLMALFDGDDDAQFVVEGLFEGMEKTELFELLDGDNTRYDTVRKRIRRKINENTPELKAMIHGER